MNDNADALISKSTENMIRCNVSGRAHYMSADIYGKKRKNLIIPTMVLSYCVSVTLFVSIVLPEDYKWLKISLGFLSLISGVLMTIETGMKFSEKSENSRLAGVKYRAISRKFELFEYKYSSKLKDDKTRNQAIKKFEELLNDLEGLAIESPTIEDSIYEKARKEVEDEIKEKIK